MHPLAELLLNCSERGSHSLGKSIAPDAEPPLAPRLVTHVRESEVVERPEELMVMKKITVTGGKISISGHMVGH